MKTAAFFASSKLVFCVALSNPIFHASLALYLYLCECVQLRLYADVTPKSMKIYVYVQTNKQKNRATFFRQLDFIKLCNRFYSDENEKNGNIGDACVTQLFQFHISISIKFFLN